MLCIVHRVSICVLSPMTGVASRGHESSVPHPSPFTVGEPQWYRAGSTRGWLFVGVLRAFLWPSPLQGSLLYPPSSSTPSACALLHVHVGNGIIECFEGAKTGFREALLASWSSAGSTGLLWPTLGGPLWPTAVFSIAWGRITDPLRDYVPT